jgi:outer membrane protein insertion porin family
MSLILLMLLTGTGTADRTDDTHVLILPFSVHAPENQDTLGRQIAAVLAEHLERDGATIIQLSAQDTAEPPGALHAAETMRALADQYKADRIIWGSLTAIGSSFSVDARMVSASAPDTHTSFNASGQSIENLLNVLKGLSDRIGMALFRRSMVTRVNVLGNQRIESDAILRVVKTKTGTIYKESQLSADLKAIFKMGYFDDIRIEAEPDGDGKMVTFHVKEKPTIRRIRIKGNLRFDDEEVKENLTLSTGAILNIFKIRSNIDQIESMYKEKNYHQVSVDYKIIPIKNNQADIEFIIEEGNKLYVTSIEFEGIKSFPVKKLRKVIKTSEKGFFSWLTSSGDMNRNELDQDASLIKGFYHNHGFTRSRVSEPQVDITPEGIHITFKIDEGPRFKVGKVDISGDLILDKGALIEKLSIRREDFYNREKLRNDVIAVRDLYGAHGFAYADVNPQVSEDLENDVVNITFDIKKRQEIYFENIFINGNTRTRDNVIRRQLKVIEQERFDGKALKRSVRNLYRLDFFEDIKINTLKGSTDDQMVLKIDVTEKPTGQFSFGAGYSSEESLFLVGSVSERNLFGKGQILKFSGEFGGSTTKYSLSFTEPWLFDMPLSGSINAYQQEKEYDEYDRTSIGAGIGFSYPVFDYTRLYWSYAYDSSEVANIDDTADDTIKELEGTNVTSSTTLSLGYDSRDSALNPSEGSKHRISFEYAGIGGDVGFNKVTAETGWYFPLFKGLVGFIHAKGGSVIENSDDKIIPDYEKFYLGGMNSLRGFDYRGVHLTNINNEGDETKIGGDSMIQFNVELIIPIAKKVGLMGVVFFDAGNVYGDEFDIGDLRKTAGYGFRWFSPLAPIRIEYGQILDPRDDEDEGRWEFTMGGAF